MKLKLAILLLLAFSARSQKAPPSLFETNSDLFLPTYKSIAYVENHKDIEAVKEAILSTVEYDEPLTLELTHNIKSKTLDHFHFEIYIGNTPLYSSSIHASSDDRGKLRIQNIPVLPKSITGSFPPLSKAMDIQIQYKAENVIANKEVLVYLGNDELTRARLIELSGPETLHKNVVVVGNEIVAEQDLNKYHQADGPNDSLVSVWVFDPDPLTTAQEAYGGAYSDKNDKNSPQMEAELKLRQTIFTYDNGVFKAENDYVKISDFSLPAIAPVISASPQLYYTRDSAFFEDVNVMFHITKHCQHLTALGYSNLPGYQIQIDPHALQGSDQSFFSTNNLPYRIYMGEGGVDDAEDADVIIHEFSHAVIYAAAPSSQITIERGCIEEALGDYFAASYSASVSTFNSTLVFNWDSGNGAVWGPIRSVQSTKDYGLLSFKSGSYYTNTDIFASCLMTLNKSIGRDLADELVLETIFNLTYNTNMPDFAGYMMMADTLLYNGIHAQTIHDAFIQRNIVPSISLNEYKLQKEGLITLANTYGFGKGEALHISSPVKLSAYELYTIGGQLVSSSPMPEQLATTLEFPELKSGVYMLVLETTKGNRQSFRIIRF